MRYTFRNRAVGEKLGQLHAMNESTGDMERTDFGEAVGRSFVEKLLLAIIDAHPVAEDGSLSPAKLANLRRERLAAAHQALFGKPRREGRPIISDEAALRWMGAEAYRDLFIGKENLGFHPVEKVRSERELAAEASKLFFDTDAAERLRKKFNKSREKWMDVARYHDDVPEQLEANSLGKIAEVLSRYGVRIALQRVERG